MRDRFEEIYAKGEWGNGSGEGSDPLHAAPYMSFINRFLRDHHIRSVVDLGCGDWQFSRYVDWRGVDYKGFDTVRPVIETNSRQFGAPGISFHHFDGDFATLPSADVLLVKDVMQHWSDATILSFLPSLQNYRLALLTNCVEPYGPTRNGDILDGGFRRLDLMKAPWNLAAKRVLTFANSENGWRRLRPARWRKQTLLIMRGSQD